MRGGGGVEALSVYDVRLYTKNIMTVALQYI